MDNNINNAIFDLNDWHVAIIVNKDAKEINCEHCDNYKKKRITSEIKDRDIGFYLKNTKKTDEIIYIYYKCLLEESKIGGTISNGERESTTTNLKIIVANYEKSPPLINIFFQQLALKMNTIDLNEYNNYNRLEFHEKNIVNNKIINGFNSFHAYKLSTNVEKIKTIEFNLKDWKLFAIITENNASMTCQHCTIYGNNRNFTQQTAEKNIGFYIQNKNIIYISKECFLSDLNKLNKFDNFCKNSLLDVIRKFTHPSETNPIHYYLYNKCKNLGLTATDIREYENSLKIFSHTSSQDHRYNIIKFHRKIRKIFNDYHLKRLSISSNFEVINTNNNNNNNNHPNGIVRYTPYKKQPIVIEDETYIMPSSQNKAITNNGNIYETIEVEDNLDFLGLEKTNFDCLDENSQEILNNNNNNNYYYKNESPTPDQKTIRLQMKRMFI